MTSHFRPQRKRKQPQQFSPLHHEEEKELTEALSRSLRRIPGNGSISEDDVDEKTIKKQRRKKKMMMMKNRKEMITKLNGQIVNNQSH